MNEITTICTQVLSVILAADFAAGFIHWIEDAYIRENTPLLGKFIGKPNTIHHHLPRHMIRNSWWHSNREQLIAMGILLAFLSLLDLLTWQVCLFAIIAGNANEVHKWSHRTKRENGRLICWLQDLHLLQTPRHHAVHHSNPKEVRYCPVTNVLNPLLDGIHLWSGFEWVLARVFGLHRQPDTSVPGQGAPPEWISAMRRSDGIKKAEAEAGQESHARSIPAIKMKFLLPLFLLSMSALFGQETTVNADKTSFEFKDGDRLVLLGNTVFEREQRYGAFEPRFALALGDIQVSVRNLAWSGDTVFGTARSYFGPPEEGLQRLSGHLELIKPSVAMLCYGSELAFERLQGMPDFLTSYRSLIDLLRAKCPGIRIIVVAPPPLESLQPPLPDLTTENKNLSTLRDALRKFAMMQNAYFIDWFELMGGLPKSGLAPKPLTENGLHYTQAGYEKLAVELLRGLGLKIPEAPSLALEKLRKAVIDKNALFFNRWRPQNETYLFGFRKHEQGQNAKEIPMFDPLIAQGDASIQKLKIEALAQTHRP